VHIHPIFSMSNLKVFTLFALLVASIGSIPAFAQSVIEVSTDKDSYAGGDAIILSGQVSELLAVTPMTYQVIATNGNIVAIGQFDVESDKTFSIEIKSGATWKSSGTYTIKLQWLTGQKLVCYLYLQLKLQIK